MYITEENPLLKEVYEKENYKVEFSGEGTPDICVIYFSGNNLYFPDNDEMFTKTIIEKDRYEWTKRRILRDNKKVFKEIFIRDIYKQWYVKGINAKLSTMDKLITFLSEEVNGCGEIITVGNSAGGYMAALIGCVLHASKVFCFSGQFDLSDRYENYPILMKYKDDENSGKYYDITDIIESSDVPIYYFYPAKVEQDTWQADRIMDCSNVRFFAFNQSTHGQSMYVENLPVVLAMSNQRLNSLAEKYHGKIISPLLWSVKVSDIKNTAHGFCINSAKHLYNWINKIKKKS